MQKKDSSTTARWTQTPSLSSVRCSDSTHLLLLLPTACAPHRRRTPEKIQAVLIKGNHLPGCHSAVWVRNRMFWQPPKLKLIWGESQLKDTGNEAIHTPVTNHWANCWFVSECGIKLRSHSPRAQPNPANHLKQKTLNSNMEAISFLIMTQSVRRRERERESFTWNQCKQAGQSFPKAEKTFTFSSFQNILGCLRKRLSVLQSCSI